MYVCIYRNLEVLLTQDPNGSFIDGSVAQYGAGPAHEAKFDHFGGRGLCYSRTGGCVYMICIEGVIYQIKVSLRRVK